MTHRHIEYKAGPSLHRTIGAIGAIAPLDTSEEVKNSLENGLK